eukprot:gene1480-32866_t
MIRNRFQIHTEGKLRIIPTIKEIIREGGVRQLYRGGIPEIAGLVPRATAALATLEYSRREFRSWNDGKLTPFYAHLSGALCAVPEAIVFSPFQVIKVRLMAKAHLGKYKNTMDCLKQVVEKEGVSALTIGLIPTLFRNCIWNGIYYGAVYQIDEALQPLENKFADSTRTAAIGVAVGMSATAFNIPFDVVKSRFQSQLPENIKYRHTFSALHTIYR